MVTDLRLPLMSVALVAGCGNKTAEGVSGTAVEVGQPASPTTAVVPETAPPAKGPTAAEIKACEGASMGEKDFDWACCEVWAKQCVAEGKGEECDWICNG